MKWRVAWVLALSLCLPAPLVGLIRLAVRPAPPPEPGVAPMLGPEERWKHPSFRQPCKDFTECLAPLVCMKRAPAGPGLCMDSECRTDMDCGEGFLCRTTPTLGNGPLLRSCGMLDGQREEGEPCEEALGPKHRTCKQGLRCNGGWCGRPCEEEEPSSCPPDFFCRPGLDGASCVPVCEGRGCPEGLQCAPQGGGVSVCARLEGEECWRSPCPEGLGCARLDARVRQGLLRVSMECVSACGPEHPSCPPGSHCVEGTCRRTCGEAASAPCRKDKACFQWPGMDVRLCWPL